MKLKCASSQPQPEAEHEDTDQSGDEADTAVEGDVEADLSAMFDDVQKQLPRLSLIELNKLYPFAICNGH